MQEQAPQAPIEQLEAAVAAVPPNVTAARMAVGAIVEQLPTMDEEDRLATAYRAGELASTLAQTARAAEDQGEFTNYAALMNVFTNAAGAQTAPTQTAGKAQTGGKR